MTVVSRVTSLVALLVGGLGLQAVACSKSEAQPPNPYTVCQGSDRDFVTRAMLAVNGRRPWGEAETMVYAAAMQQIRETQGEHAARSNVVRAMMQETQFRRRWGDFFMDSLRVSRARFISDDMYSTVQSQACYGKEGTTLSLVTAGPELAEFVRDNSPSTTSPPIPGFTLNTLFGSALALDDLSPIYRAHLIHRMSFPIPGANVAPDELERQRRHSFGVSFEDTYLNRNITCLGCHNSDWSETPERTFPLPYRPEAAVFGGPNAPLDPLQYRSVFRYDGVADVSQSDPSGEAPWGWDRDFCGVLERNASIDPLDIEASFASIMSTSNQPNLGKLASVWLLESSLARGFEGLRDGIELDANGNMSDPDEAFAFLVSANIVERVWEEIIGSPLSIAHTLPRNAEQRDNLLELTQSFIDSDYSLKSLLVNITAHPLFNVAPASSSCWGEAYALPPTMDPFTADVSQPSERNNGPGERVYFLSTRVVLSAMNVALERPAIAGFPSKEGEELWQRSVGLTLSQDVPGFRGLDLQARLAWESRHATCGQEGDDDFISDLLARAASADATVEDVVVALKDRMISEPRVTDGERGPTEALLDRALSERDIEGLEAPLRLLCGALVVSPQFTLGGLGTDEGIQAVPELTPPEHDVDAHCGDLQARLAELGVMLTRCQPHGAGHGG